MFTAAVHLPHRPRRVLVAGVSGSGKTTLASRLALVLDLPYTEIDSLFHGPNWVPRADFMSDVGHLTTAPGWIIEWQYGVVRPLLAARADTLLWLDFSTPLTMGRLIRRTVRRRIRQAELWNGNVEGPLLGVFTDPDHIIRWAWRTRHQLKSAVPKLEHEHPGLQVLRFTAPRDVEAWLCHLGAFVASERGRR